VPLYNHGPSQEELKASTSPICLNWKIASDNALSKVVNSGQAYTSSDIDYTVKIEATGLAAFTQYYYQFTICSSNVSSPIGRSKTTPNANDNTAAVKLAVYSCSNFPFGFFNAYGNPVRKNSVDYVIHLGNLISPTGSNRV
jgi:alkaline phosphatase D